ncbi:unnamed protein product [Meganyctiphanes norvegica]|uniref:Sulfatase N-terminal domain-containing protein n=1 Tax=Meganyctiphanes norvegica TaxID=48144 RepID=A0AAV2RDQ4_MEGNR
MEKSYLYLLVTLFQIIWRPTAAQQPPNIVFIFVDDLGWNHVSWHNPSVITPHLQELVDNGVLLDQNYLQPCCTPSRSALMTGTYPYKLGRQGNPLAGDQPTGLSMNYTLLPEALKTLGYSTHMVGKWHLGMCDWAYTPTYRGFDTFTGYWLTMGTYYNHTNHGNYDFHQQERVMWEADGIYSTDIYTEEAIKVIEEHQNQEQPFFLYFAHQNVHSPYKDCVPQHYLDLYPDVLLPNVRHTLAMVTAMDDSVGNIVDALKATGQYDNTVIVWSTDNGGAKSVRDSNIPLRGSKFDLWEGGTRGPGFVHSPLLLQDTPRTYDGLIHVTDWYNTLLAVAGVSEALPNNDGVNQWDAIRTGHDLAPRDEFIYNLDQFNDTIKGAIRQGNYKYVMGETNSLDGGETGPWLFNIKDDPNELTNLVSEEPLLATSLEVRLLSHLEDMVPADEPEGDPAGDPGNYGGVVTPGWCVAH